MATFNAGATFYDSKFYLLKNAEKKLLVLSPVATLLQTNVTFPFSQRIFNDCPVQTLCSAVAVRSDRDVHIPCLGKGGGIQAVGTARLVSVCLSFSCSRMCTMQVARVREVSAFKEREVINWPLACGFVA